MLDAYDEKLIAARDYLAEAFPGCSVSEFAGEAEFLIGVTTRSFRIERDDVSTLITLTHQFFRDTKVTSVIGRLSRLPRRRARIRVCRCWSCATGYASASLARGNAVAPLPQSWQLRGVSRIAHSPKPIFLPGKTWPG